MITIFSGTNRPNSNSLKVANHYLKELQARGEAVQLYNLADLPADFIQSEMYGQRSEAFAPVVEKYVENANQFIFVLGEYNGSFPGIMKTLVDSVDPSLWHHKKAALVGLSAGHSGCLLGLAQFCGVLQYLQMEVLSAKPKLSSIDALLNGEGGVDRCKCH